MVLNDDSEAAITNVVERLSAAVAKNIVLARMDNRLSWPDDLWYCGLASPDVDVSTGAHGE